MMMKTIRGHFKTNGGMAATLLAVWMGNNTARGAVADFGDPSMWTPSVYGTGVSSQIVDNGAGFQADFAANAQPVNVPPFLNFPAGNGMFVNYISTFALHGDFTLEVNYALDLWPSAPNGILLGITLSPFVGTLRESTIYTGDAYAFAAGGYVSMPTTDLSGTLAMTRVGGTLSGYYWSAAQGAWVGIGSAAGFSQDLSLLVNAGLSGTYGGHAVEVTLSNLEIGTQPLTGTIIPVPAPPPSSAPEAGTAWCGLGAVGLVGWRQGRSSRAARDQR